MNSMIAANTDTTRNVIELITGGWRAQALYTAVKLGLPDLIEAGQTTSGELATATGVRWFVVVLSPSCP